MTILQNLTVEPVDGTALFRGADNDRDNPNMIVMTGAGEEGDALVKVVLSRYLAGGAKVWMWDHTGEFHAFCGKSCGQIINARLLSLNPFAHVVDIEQSVPGLCEWLLSLANADMQNEAVVLSAMRHAVRCVWRNRQNRARIDDVVKALEGQAVRSEEVRKVTTALRQYQRGGTLGQYFLGTMPSLCLEDGLLLFSFERMEAQEPELYRALTLTLLLTARLDMQQSRKRRDVVCVLESDVLDASFAEPHAQSLFRQALSTARREGGEYLIHGYQWPDCQSVTDALKLSFIQIIYLTSPLAARFLTAGDGHPLPDAGKSILTYIPGTAEESLFIRKTNRHDVTLNRLWLSDAEMGQCIDRPEDDENLMELRDMGLTHYGALQFLGAYRRLGETPK